MSDIKKAVEGAKPAHGSGKGEPPDDPSLDLKLSRLPQNDIGNAERLVKRHGRDLLYVSSMGWHSWQGTHWSREDGEQEVQRRAKATATAIRAEVAAAQEAGPWTRESEDEDEDGEESKSDFRNRLSSLLKFAIVSGNATRVRAMGELAQSDLSHRREELDADPWLLNVENGTIELRHHDQGGVKLREHRRDDLMTRLAPVRYDKDAAAPKFMAWLAQFQPHAALQLFLQRWAGYSLTGDTGEQVVSLWYGGGANGKSTLLNVLRGLLGPYCQTVPVEALLEDERKSGGSASPQLARLPGIRLAFASEPEKKRRLSTSAIKQLTGGEPVAARELNQGYFEFMPSFKLTMSFNDRPSVPAQDDGTWRRILLVPFDVQIDPAKKVNKFEEVLLQEAPGILNWALDGFRLWRERGLEIPKEIRAATDEYRIDSDHIGEFLGMATRRPEPGAAPEVISAYTVGAAQLYEVYEKWCKDNAIDPVKKTGFGRALSARRVRRSHSNGRYYIGIDLREEFKKQGAMVT